MPFPKMKAQGYQFSNHSTCRDCRAEIEWWTTPRGKKMPMDLMTEQDDSPAVSHWSTCPNAANFRK